MRIVFEGSPGEGFTRVIRHLPDQRDWLVSDPERPVVLARSEGELIREVVLTVQGEGPHDLEWHASRGVVEWHLQALVAVALIACIGSLAAAWWWFPHDVMGLMLGLVLAATVPNGVMAVGQRVVDPGRDLAAEAQLERALRYSVALLPGVSTVD